MSRQHERTPPASHPPLQKSTPDRAATDAHVASVPAAATAQAAGLQTIRDSTRQRAQHEQIRQLQETPAAAPPSGGSQRLPPALRAGIAALSGQDLGDVQVHRNSAAPAQMQALAYAQGNAIHLGPGQDQHLPHEAWHIVQQRQGRVPVTRQLQGVALNDDRRLEHEADSMGQKAAGLQLRSDARAQGSAAPSLPAVAAPLQRKTGFEMELHVPVYTTPPGVRQPNILKRDTALTASEERDIKTYLGGGLEYGVDYGHDGEDRFDITADHGAYSRTHSALVAALGGEGYIDPHFLFRSMTNIEYRTPPLEEREAGATARLNSIAAAVKAHAANTAAKSKLTSVQNLNAPALNLHTGVPVTALNKLVSSGSVDLKGKVSDAQTAVQPFVYFQTNTGVLPSEIPELFRQASAAIWGKYAFDETPKTKAAVLMLDQAIALGQSLAVKAKAIVADAAFEYLFDDVPDSDLQSLQGWITLVAQYLLAYQLEQSDFLPGNSTGKNLVAYLSKTPLPTSLQALPQRVRPFINNTGIGQRWEALFTELVSDAAKVTLVATSGLTANANPHSKVIGSDALVWLKAVLSGGTPWTVQTGRPLGLDKDQEKHEPKLKVQGEQAIVLEDRYSELKLSDDDLKNMDKIEDLIKGEWQAAVGRRKTSTVAPDTDTAATDASAKQTHAWLVESTLRWIKVAQDNYGVGDPTLPGWQRRLNDNDPLLDAEDHEYSAFNINLKALKREVIAHVDGLQRTRNDSRHEWLTEINYRDIEYQWKSQNDHLPVLHKVGDRVWVKQDGKWLEAQKKGGYFVYADKSAAEKKIERAVGGAVTYYTDSHAWSA